MRRNILAAGVALAVILPSAALAQETCEQRSQNRTAGTAVGAVAGAVIGGSVAAHHHKTEGAVIGGLLGGLLGNQVAKGPKDCAHAYGWYDDRGGWHRNDVDANTAWGYYDQRGEWVEGRPADWRPADYAPPPPPPPPAYVRRDWDDDHGWDAAGPGYPDLRRMEDHIREAIRDGVRSGRLDRDDAHEFWERLSDVRADEAAEYREHGWRLPPQDHDRLRERLRRLDHRVDEAADRG